jgi:hypothetical protein
MTNSPRFRIFQASSSDEERLKILYSEKSRDGSVQINLDRSPGFFDALQVEGYENGVFAVEDTESGILAGAGIRNIRKCYINGEVQKIGYLSGLRVAENYRKSRAMAMIFIRLRELYMQGECAGYLCSVFNSNKTAIQGLTSGKAGMPVFRLVGTFNTFVFKPSLIKTRFEKDVQIRQANNTDIEELCRFINTEGSKHQYFPYLTPADINQTQGLLKNLNISDIFIATRNNEITGCLALWDQTAFRRWKVEGYSNSMKILRPIINFLFYFIGLPRMPKSQTVFNYRLLSLVCIRNNDRNIFAALYNEAIRNIPKNKKVLISAGFFEKDVLIKSLPRLKLSFKSSIFIGNWKETQSEIDKIDNRNPYVEAGSL